MRKKDEDQKGREARQVDERVAKAVGKRVGCVGPTPDDVLEVELFEN